MGKYYDVDLERENLRAEQKQGQSHIAVDDGTTLPFTQENVMQKLREGFQMVSVNYENQKSGKMYSYLTKERTRVNSNVYAPVTFSPLFNEQVAGQTRLFKAVVQSVQTSMKNMLGQSAYLEKFGINLKIIGGGTDLEEVGGFIQGGERIYSNAGMFAGRGTVTGGEVLHKGQTNRYTNATQIIN